MQRSLSTERSPRVTGVTVLSAAGGAWVVRCCRDDGYYQVTRPQHPPGRDIQVRVQAAPVYD